METRSFWNLVAQSGLVPPGTTDSLSAQFEAEQAERENPPSYEELARWLQAQGAITQYQAQILGAGHCGPFFYGEYLVEQPAFPDFLDDCYLARHRPTQHPVMLQFIPGRKPSDLEQWNDLVKLTEQLREIDCPHLTPIFATLVLPQFRMVVTGRPPGRPLGAVLPAKSRMPWADACVVAAQVAEALHALHQRGIVHNAVSPRTVWMDRGGLVQLKMALRPDLRFEQPDLDQPNGSESRLDYLAPEAYVETTVDSPELSCQSDLYALGCLLFRAITGRVVFPEDEIPRKRWMHANAELPALSRFEIPEPLEQLIRQLLAKTPAGRPDSARSVAKALAKLAGDRLKVKPVPGVSPSKTPSWEPFRQALRRWEPGAIAPEETEITIAADEPEQPVSGRPADERIERARQLAQKRKKNRWMMPVAIGSALLVISLLVGTTAYLANQRPYNRPIAKLDENAAATDSESHSASPTSDAPSNPDAGGVRLVQELIPDDRNTLWQSPTSSPPPQLSYLPSNPRIAALIRPQELLKDPEGLRLLESLGPAFRTALTGWQEQIGLELADIERLVVTFHSTPENRYEVFFQVELPAPADRERLLQLWRSPPATTLENGETVYGPAAGSVFYAVPDSAGEELSRTFLFGPRPLVEQVIEVRGATPWSGPIQRLSQWLDRDRHFSLLFLRQALFNDEGQQLMSGQWGGLNRQLRWVLDESIRGGLLSIHLDEGTYLELVIDRSAEKTAREMATELESRLRGQLDLLSRLIDTTPSHPYWDQARRRFLLMFGDLFDNLRFGVEYGEVVANAWLPPMAAHNLVAATELLTAFANGAGTSAAVEVPPRSVPASLEALLAEPRDLKVTTNPDLNILLQSIRDEVVNDYGQLPFDFQIRLMGNDLQLEGITQNQRPGDFEMMATPLSAILTQIMVRCNPQKDISGPDDPNCKLIWVVAEDPESPGNQAILVTTRAAATERGYRLPPEFRSNEE